MLNQNANKPEIVTSFDNIRIQVMNRLLGELGLSETDLHRGTFVSYIIDILSHLTANIMYYSGVAYRESFMTLAQLPDSVYNLSAFLGYNPKNAIAPSCDVLIQIPLDAIVEPVNIEFRKGHKFYAGDIIYYLKYNVTVSIDNDQGTYNVVVTDVENNVVYSVPYVIQDNVLSFTVTTVQEEEIEFNSAIPLDLKPFVFYRHDIKFNNQMTDIKVFVDNVEWKQFSAISLMTADDKGYVCKITQEGAAIFFGNNLFGKQPHRGATLKIVVKTTLGEDGRIASYKIKKGDRIIYDTQSGKKVLNYFVTNPNTSIGGSDLESIDEVRRNALLHIQSLNRLVSQYDFDNFASITNMPFFKDSVSILKRSDLKCNEVNIFTVITFSGEIVPTRTIPVSGRLDELFLKPLTPVTFENREYMTLFEYKPDPVTRFVSVYYYALGLNFAPTIVSENIQNNEIVLTSGEINTDLDNRFVSFKLYYTSPNPSQFIAELLLEDNLYTMVNNTNDKYFYFNLNLDDIPFSFVKLDFKIYDNNQNLKIYATTSQIIKQCLDEITFSQLRWLGSETIEYLIPVIDKDWYDSLSDFKKSQFQSLIVQRFVQGASQNVYRMLNTSVNVQFANTIGRLTNTRFNVPNYTCISTQAIASPQDPSKGDTYLILEDIDNTNDPWYGHKNDIAICVDEQNVTWTFVKPTTSTIVYDNDTGKKLIWSGEYWLDIESLHLPITIEADVYLDISNRDSAAITSQIKEVLTNYFRGYFGILQPLFRSELTRIIQTIPGVAYCKLLKPEFDIFFNFEISKLDQIDLFKFSPDYPYFKDIKLNVRPYTAKVE